jgi:protein prenyltransferase alpha subunit repeat containing protein 1
MSRALDPETTASVRNPLPVEIYTEIVSVLCTPRSLLLEIELLGKAHPMPPGKSYLLEDKYLAIPKVRLVQAFVVARQVFFKLAQNCPKGKEGELQNASAIILLMDPEHVTAANARKRMLLNYEKGEDVREGLRRELQFVDTLLTARLHRHTKSPNLWSHRRWLLQQYQSFSLEVHVREHLERIILVAAERHPRNYYAWSHMRWLVDTSDLTGKTKKEIISRVQDWCVRHPNDTSGFSFLLFCLEVPGTSETEFQDVTRVYNHILELALSFKWAHESVWVFLRTLAASRAGFGGPSLSFQEGIDTALEGCAEDPKAQLILKAAIKWFNENQQAVPSRSDQRTWD